MPHRVLKTASEIIEQNARMRAVIEKSIKVLKKYALPDSFLGRKTQEPFPKQDEENEE